MKKMVKSTLEKVVVKTAKNACGRASVSIFCQPKEPQSVRTAFEKK
ncbi:MAG: hypothetical protein IJD02_05120 [Lachnospiraceae bacterium]|nr:hypothetical protein [Lachnospiraceae bacterium]